MENRYAYLLFITFACVSTEIHAQAPTEKKQHYLIVHTGLSIDNPGRGEVDAQFYVEYQRQLKKNWLMGVSFEHTTYLTPFPFFKPDLNIPLIKANNSFLCLNAYYQIKIPNRRWSFTAGAGIGLMRLTWSGYSTIKPVVNASLTLNVPISSKVDLQLLPFVTLGNRAYYSPYRIGSNENSYLKLNLFPVGVRIKL